MAVEEIGGLLAKADAAGAEGATASGNSQANGPQPDDTLESNAGTLPPFTDGARSDATANAPRFDLNSQVP
jgi:hypothetical protein